MSKSVENDDALGTGQLEEFENCNLCNTINCMHEQFNISPLLNKVSQWDYSGYSQMRIIRHFFCYVCNVSTKSFSSWKKHIMSTEHTLRCHKVNNLFSYSCGACKVLFYGSKTHISDHRYNFHRDKSAMPRVSLLMADLLKHLAPDSCHWYFCSHCKIISKNQIHNLDLGNFTNQVHHYCKYCNVTFLCSHEVLDCHTLSVEHMTLKCIYLIKEATDENNLEDETEIQEAEVTKCLDKKPLVLKLPVIMLDRFQNISVFVAKCKLCLIFIDWSTNNVIHHIIYVCTNKGNLTSNSHNTSIDTYDCRICCSVTQSFSIFADHVISPTHLSNCHSINDLYSYFCTACNLYMYCPKQTILNHRETKHKSIDYENGSDELPYMSRFLSVNYNYISNHPEYKSINLFHDNQSKINDSCCPPANTLYQCYYCKIDFGQCSDDFYLHMISSEHIILNYLTSKSSLDVESYNKHQNKSTMIINSTMDEIDLDNKMSSEKNDHVESLQALNNDEIEKECHGNYEWLFNRTELKNLYSFNNESVSNSVIEVFENNDENTSYSEKSTNSVISNSSYIIMDTFENKDISFSEKSPTNCIPYVDLFKNNDGNTSFSRESPTNSEHLINTSYLDTFKNNGRSRSISEKSTNSIISNVSPLNASYILSEFKEYDENTSLSGKPPTNGENINISNLDTFENNYRNILSSRKSPTNSVNSNISPIDKVDKISQIGKSPTSSDNSNISPIYKVGNISLPGKSPTNGDDSYISLIDKVAKISLSEKSPTNSENSNISPITNVNGINSTAEVSCTKPSQDQEVNDVPKVTANMNSPITERYEHENNVTRETVVEDIKEIDHTVTPINNISTAMLNETLSNIIKLHDQLKPTDADESYGQYVTQRLKNVRDESLKCQIKLEIDFLFYSKMIQQTKDSVENQ